MNVLIACEFSGTVREAFRKLGHNAWSCDLIEAEDSSEFHYQGDVTPWLRGSWDLLIAHPPCTRLCNSGVRWLNERNLWEEMKLAAEFFKQFLYCDIPKRAIENPIMHSYAKDIIGKNYNQIIHPWQFGHAETKSTCLWLHGLPRLIPTEIMSDIKHSVHMAPPSPMRSTNRSRTYKGIAEAMANQWGKV